MKILKKTCSLFLLIILCFSFLGCPFLFPCDCYKHLYNHCGLRISNFPEWTNENEFGIAFSTWYDWQESGKVKEIFSQLYEKNDYEGKYRFLVYGQTLGIEFEDGEFYIFMHGWIGEVTGSDNSYKLPQKDNDLFEFDCVAKFNFDDSSLDKKARITFNKVISLDDYSVFNYKVVFDDEVFINCRFKTYKDEFFENYDKPEWLPRFFYEDNTFNVEKYYLDTNFSYYEQKEVMLSLSLNDPLIKDDAFLGYNLYLGKFEYPIIFCCGGIKEISINSYNKCVNYELIDGPLRLPKFLEIKINEDNTSSFTWYNILADGEKEIVLVENLYIKTK